MNMFDHSLHKPNIEVFLGLLQANPDELHIMHCAAHGDKESLINGSKHSK